MRSEAKFEGSLRERVRCSSLVDWPVYPRLAHTMRASKDTQCGADACVRNPRSVARRAEIAMAVEKVIEVTPQGWADRGAGRAARPFSLRQRRERAAKARRNRWVSSERLSHHGIMRSLPLRTFSQRRALRYSGWQPTRACFFRPKACQYPRFMGRRASSSRISSRHVPEPCTSREPEGRRSCDIPRRGPRRASGSRLAVRLKIRVISGLMTGADEAGHGAPDLLDLRDCLEIHGEGEVAEAITSLRHMSDARPSEVVRQYGDAVGGQHVEHPNAALRRLR